jgi:hypothetical protein
MPAAKTNAGGIAAVAADAGGRRAKASVKSVSVRENGLWQPCQLLFGPRVEVEAAKMRVNERPEDDVIGSPSEHALGDQTADQHNGAHRIVACVKFLSHDLGVSS